MLRRTAAALSFALIFAPSLALAQAGGGSPVYQSWAQIGSAIASWNVTSSSSNQALPTGGNVAKVCNQGSTDAYVAMGVDNTVTASTNSTWIQAGTCASINLVPYTRFTYIAGITASGTTTLRVEAGVGSPLASKPSSGGGGGSPGGTSGQVQYNNGGSFGGFTASGDATINTATGAITVTKTNGALIGTAATQNTGTSGGTLCLLNSACSYSGAQRGTPVNVAIATSTFTPNFNTAQNFELDLSSACPCTLANPSTTLVAGQSGMIEIHQDATGSRTIGTWGTDYLANGGTSAIALSTAASAVDYLPYYVNNAGTGIVLGSPILAPSH